MEHQLKQPATNQDRKPPLGLKPRNIHEEEVKIARFLDVCGAISRFYRFGKQIPLEWIQEYNELVQLEFIKQSILPEQDGNGNF